jgi:hypothetical protein
MAITLASEPQYPLPGKTVRLTLTPSGGGNYVRLLCSAAPQGSKLQAEIDSLGAARVAVLEGDTSKRFDFTPDKAGAYVFAALEILKGASATAPGPGYEKDPDGYSSEAIIGETAVTLRVGTRLSAPVGVSPDVADLVLYVWDGTIRQTLEAVHGERSPWIRDPKTDKARNAVLSVGVTGALAAFIDIAATTIVGSASTVVTNLIDKFNAHRTQASVHAANDTNNAIDGAYRNPSTPEALKLSVNELLRKLERHILNDNAGAGPGSAGYHAPGGSRAGDWAAKPLARTTGDLASTLAALGGLHLSYETHRATAGAIHDAADSTNVATALPVMLAIHSAFIAELIKTSPTPPSTANAGAVVLVSGAGMREG